MRVIKYKLYCYFLNDKNYFLFILKKEVYLILLLDKIMYDIYFFL